MLSFSLLFQHNANKHYGKNNRTRQKTTNALKTLNDAKQNILFNINLDRTTENISESVQEKASAALDLLKEAKKDIFNRFK